MLSTLLKRNPAHARRVHFRSARATACACACRAAPARARVAAPGCAQATYCFDDFTVLPAAEMAAPPAPPACDAATASKCARACAAAADTPVAMGGIHPRSKKPVGDRLGVAAAVAHCGQGASRRERTALEQALDGVVHAQRVVGPSTAPPRPASLGVANALLD